MNRSRPWRYGFGALAEGDGVCLAVAGELNEPRWGATLTDLTPLTISFAEDPGMCACAGPGRDVSCVAHRVKALTRAGLIGKRDEGKLVREAARAQACPPPSLAPTIQNPGNREGIEEWLAPGEVDGHPDTTVVFIRRPADHGRFSGTVIGEPLHATSPYGAR